MSRKILVVDDDPVTVRSVETLLRSKNYEVISAYDGLEGLEKIKKENPDLVVLDIMMPEMNGYDVCYQLRFNKDFEKLPIVLLTVRDQELEDRISEMAHIEYTQKPVEPQILLEKVEHLLSK
jgi:DNA-binding response OmpR family regulator